MPRKTIDITPSWEGLLPVLLMLIQLGDSSGRDLAKAELRKMAKAADLYNASIKQD